MAFFKSIKETLKQFPSALRETISETKWLPKKIREPVRKVYRFITPQTPEEARKMGMIPITKTALGEPLEHPAYVDVFGLTGGLANVAARKGTTLAGWIFNKLSKKPTVIKSTAKELIKTRYSDIKTGLLDTEVFVKKIERVLPNKADREIIPFIIEGTQEGTKLQQKVAKKVSSYYDEGFNFLKENLDDVGFVKNYVNHIWDIPKNKRVEAISRFTLKNPFLKQRTIPTLKEGIEMGLKPKTTDIAEMLRIYDIYKHNTVANTRFVKGLTKMTDDTGQKLIQRVDKAPADWKLIDHPALRRAIGIKAGEGKLLLPKIPVKVNPEIAKEVEVVLGQPLGGVAVRAVDTIYAFTKKAALSLSFFHHTALTESAISAGIGKKVLKLLNPQNIYKALRNGQYDIFKKLPLTRDALQHQLQLGALPDVQRHRVHQTLQAIERKTKSIPLVKTITKGIRGFNEIWDKALWDYYHNGLKLFTYEKWTQEALKKYPNKATKQLKEEVAQLVNDTFGGQVWDNLLVTPKAQQALHWLLLSPDWTLSTLRQAASPFAKGIRGKLGRKFWLRAAFYFWGGSNALNYAMTKKHTGEGKWMWENDPKHKTYIFIGFNEDGSKKYLRFGKQYREIFEWFANPIKKFGGKLAPVTREAYTQLSGYTPTGWKTEWADKEFFDPKGLEERAKSLIKMGLPYSVSTISRSKNLLGIAFPISKGLSWYEGRELMMDAIDRRDKEYLAEIWRALLENNLDAKKIFQSAKSEVKLGKQPKYKETEKLIRDLQKLSKEEGIKKLQEMRESNELTPEVEKQIIKILKGQAKVKKQREKIGILPLKE